MNACFPHRHPSADGRGERNSCSRLKPRYDRGRKTGKRKSCDSGRF